MSEEQKHKRIIQLELNEISLDALQKLVATHHLPTWKKILSSWKHIETTSETEYQNLEPWIQWPTAHTGVPLSEHNVFHLGDIDKLVHPQIWEVLSEQDIESCILGSMNVKRGSTKGGLFFPDPWTFNGKTYPDNLQPLWNFISNKVQTHATSTRHSAADLYKVFQLCRHFQIPTSTYLKIIQQLITQKFTKSKRWKLASLFDLFLSDIFRDILKKTNFKFYTLFLNSVAHYQHHFWRNFETDRFDPNVVSTDCATNDNPVFYGYAMFDKILANILALINNDPNTYIVIASGLSQIPYTEKEPQGGMCYYRLSSHQKFLNKLALSNVRALPLMSRDWQISGKLTDLTTAEECLSGLHIKDSPLFKISMNAEDHLFIETAVTRHIEPEEVIQSQDGTNIGTFGEFFTKTAVKSGHHTGIGHLFVCPNAKSHFPTERVALSELFNFPKEVLLS